MNQYIIKKDASKVPLIFSEHYDFSFLGFEKLNPFDVHKMKKIYDFLIFRSSLKDEQFISAPPVNEEDLRLVHTPEYLNTLKEPRLLNKYLGLSFLNFLPPSVIDKFILQPMTYATGGTILSGYAALEYGWAINLGGGYHHASSNSGGGFSIYADVSIAVKHILKHKKKVKKILIADLDAHQGNGTAHDFPINKNVAIYDVYNQDIYPHDNEALKNVTYPVGLPTGTGDKAYLDILRKTFEDVIKKSKPDLIFYNAGTDAMAHDSTGRMKMSEDGIMMRDEFIFETAFAKKIPIAMVMGGGYNKNTYKTVGESIINLIRTFKLAKI